MVVIAVGTDHRGYALKEQLKQVRVLGEQEITWQDEGCFSEERTDYPVYTQKVCGLLLAKKVDYGILLCGSGVGMAIAANRYKYIYAALVWNPEVARSAKEDDNANVLVLPSDYINYDRAKDIITAWLTASFKEGRYAERLVMLENK